MKKTLLLPLLLALAGVAGAQGVYEPATKFTPESTQAQLAEQQKLQRVQGEVGGVSPSGEAIADPGQVSDDADAAETVASVQGLEGPSNPEAQQQAEANLKDAAVSVAREGSDSGWSMGFWGLFICALVFGAVYGGLKWSERLTPSPTPARSPSTAPTHYHIP